MRTQFYELLTGFAKESPCVCTIDSSEIQGVLSIEGLDYQLALVEGPEMLHILVQDYGIPFDPLQTPEPDVNAGIDERPIGGLGFHFVRSLTQKMAYERKEESNIIHLYIAL